MCVSRSRSARLLFLFGEALEQQLVLMAAESLAAMMAAGFVGHSLIGEEELVAKPLTGSVELLASLRSTPAARKNHTLD